MIRSIAFSALALLVIGTTGCGCCRSRVAKRQPTCAPQPVCAPMCAPTCAPTCDPCGNPGGVTYNYGGAAPAMMMPGTTMPGVQMMESTGGCSTCAQ